jgi:hypothetical protein
VSTATWRRLARPAYGNNASTGPRRGGQLPLDLSSVVVRSLSALGLAGGALATVLVLQGPSTEVEGGTTVATRLVTSTGALEVGKPSVTLVHQSNEMVGMPASAAHRSGGEVLIPVTLTNTSGGSITYAADQFHLVVDGKTVDAAGEAADGTLRELRPDAAISLRLTFSQVSLVHGGQLRYVPTAGAPVTAPLDPLGETGQPSTGASAASGAGSTGNVHEAH